MATKPKAKAAKAASPAAKTVASFDFIRGINDTAVIRGTDKYGEKGSVVVNTYDYDSYLEIIERKERGEKADELIKEFWAPLQDKLDALVPAADGTPDPLDPAVVLDEGVEPVAGKPARRFYFTYDSTLIRAVVDGHHNRLAWVDGALFVEALA